MVLDEVLEQLEKLWESKFNFTYYIPMKIQNNQLIKEVVISINEIQEMQRELANLENQKARIQEHIDRINFELEQFEKLPKKEIAKIVKSETQEQKVTESNIVKEAIQNGKIFVNINDNKPIIHVEYTDWLEYDEHRWDMFFDTIEDAENFVSEYK